MSWFGWTDDILAKAKRLYVDEGQSSGEVAKRIGATRNQVIGKVYRGEWTSQRSEAVKMVHKLNAVARAGKASREAGAAKPKAPKAPRRLKIAGNGAIFKASTSCAPLPTPEASLAALNENSRQLTCFELTPSTCKYGTHEDEHGHRFCGHPVKEGSPYCDGHARVCVTATSSIRDLMRSVRRYAA